MYVSPFERDRVALSRISNAHHVPAERRAYMVMDWYVRFVVPLWLDLCPSFAPAAAALRALPEIRRCSHLDAVFECASDALAAIGDIESTAAWNAAAASRLESEDDAVCCDFDVIVQVAMDTGYAFEGDVPAAITHQAWGALGDAARRAAGSCGTGGVARVIRVAARISASAHEMIERLIDVGDDGEYQRGV